MTDQQEYVFMSVEMLHELRRKGEVESASELQTRGRPPQFAHYQGKKVITTPRRSGMLPEGEITTHPPQHVLDWARGTWWYRREFGNQSDPWPEPVGAE